MEHELNIAHNIQMALLPQSFPEHSDIDLYATQTPARDVGGDLYDYFVHNGRLLFCIGDVSGKGVPAALLMAVMRSMFRSEAHRGDSAAEIVETMNRNLCEEYTGGDFVTMFVGILDLSSGCLDYCNAGHEQPVVAGQPLDIKSNLPVGALPDWSFEGQQTQLKPGDMLFLYTDGLSEAKNNEDELLGRKRVRQLASEQSNGTAQQLIEMMEAEVHRHAGDAKQNDDITMLAIKWQPNEMMMSASMDEISCIKPFIAHVAKQAGMEEKEAKRLRLAVEEAVANIINHGQATTINLQAKTDDSQLVLTINDDGQPFDPTVDSSTDFSVPADQRPPGGLGIMFLHEMTDGLEYQRVDGHNVLRIIKGKKVKR
jgi:sigma-B regulation protein RsbU (phosphoserine phosphatase)